MIFKKQKCLLMERLDDRFIVFDINKNLPYVLNDAAAYILSNTDGKMSTEEIAERVCRRYDVEFQKTLDDIKNIYEDFNKKNIVIKVE